MDNNETIRNLLDELNDWGQYAPGGNIADTGEVSSMIDNLKGKLSELGVTVNWNGERFVIEEIKEK
jgi:hypothetical protein